MSNIDHEGENKRLREIVVELRKLITTIEQQKKELQEELENWRIAYERK